MERPVSPLKWAFLPPVVAVPTILIAWYFGSPSAAEPVDASLWGLTGLLFFILTILYVLFILQGRTTGFLSVQLIAQGLLLCPLALSFGARMLQWLGVTLAVCGAVVLVAIYYYSPAGPHPDESAENGGGTGSGSELPVPFAVTDSSGHILSISDALLEIAGVSRETALSSDITLFLIPGEDTATLGEKAWTVSQYPMKDDRFYFQLEPRTLSDISQPPQPADAFVDPLTSLNTYEYAMRRLEEELYCVRRYDHFLSAALIRFAFPPSLDSDPGVDEGFRAWCRAVRNVLRASDLAFLLGPRDAFLILPETDGDAAEAVIAKLETLIPTLSSSHPTLSSAVLLRLTDTVKSGPGIPDADALVRRVEEALRAKYTLE